MTVRAPRGLTVGSTARSAGEPLGGRRFRCRRGDSAAEQIARNAPLAVAATKQILRETQGRTEAEFQAKFIPRIFESEDAKEGLQSFAEKRSADWVGR